MFDAWGGSLGASVRENVRVCLAGSGRFCLEGTVRSVQCHAMPCHLPCHAICHAMPCALTSCLSVGGDPAAHGHWCAFTDLCHAMPCHTVERRWHAHAGDWPACWLEHELRRAHACHAADKPFLTHRVPQSHLVGTVAPANETKCTTGRSLCDSTVRSTKTAFAAATNAMPSRQRW